MTKHIQDGSERINKLRALMTQVFTDTNKIALACCCAARAEATTFGGYVLCLALAL